MRMKGFICGVIAGDVVLLGVNDDSGDTLDLDDAQREMYLELLGEDVS